MGIHRGPAGLRKGIVGNDGGVAVVGQVQPLVDEVHAAGRVDPAALGLDEELQLPPAGIDLPLIPADEAVQKGLGGALGHLGPVFGALPLAQNLLIGGARLGQEGVFQQGQLPGAVGDDVVLNIAQQDQVLHVAVAAGVVAALGVGNEVVGEGVLRLAHHGLALGEHLAAVGDERILHVAQALRHGAHQLRVVLHQVHGGLVVPLAGGDGHGLALAQLVQIVRQHRLQHGEHLIAPGGIRRLHHRVHLVDFLRIRPVLRQDGEIGLEGGQLFVPVLHRRRAVGPADGGGPDLVDAAGGVVLPLGLPHLVVAHFQGGQLVQALQVIGVPDVEQVHRLTGAEVIGDFVRLGVIGKVQGLDLLIRHRRAAGGDVLQRGGGGDIEPGVSPQLRLVVDLVLPRLLRRGLGQLIHAVAQGGQVNQVGADGQGRGLDGPGVDVDRPALIPEALGV